MRTWVAISHSKKNRYWISCWFKWICAVFGENKRFSYISLWFLLTFASDACLRVCAFTHSFDMVKPKPLIPCLSFLINQWPFSTVLAYPLLPAMAGREQKSYGKLLTQFYPGSRQVQEQQKMNAGWVSRKRVDLPAPQRRGRWASGYLDVCQPGCWASGNPGQMQRDTVSHTQQGWGIGMR